MRVPFLPVLIALYALVAQPVGAQENPAHAEIRTMRDGAIAAFVARDKDALLGYFTDDMVFTAMNNEVVRGREEAADYYDRMLEGSRSLVEEMSVDFAVDDLTTLHAGDGMGVAAGDVTTAFDMRAGLSFSVPLRWTATLVEEGDDWKIAALHFSANMFDNPLDSGVRRYLWLMLAGAALAGLVLGLLAGRIMRR